MKEENIELTEPAQNKLDWNSWGISFWTNEAASGKAVEVMSQLLLQWDWAKTFIFVSFKTVLGSPSKSSVAPHPARLAPVFSLLSISVAISGTQIG